MSPNQEKLYNTFLKYQRYGEPYTERKNFDNLKEETKNIIVRLTDFFERFPQIDIVDFFYAPISVHPDEKYPYLDFFLGRPAIKVYNIYKKKKEAESPESQLDEIKKSLHFIGMFCLKNKIDVDKYIFHKEGHQFSWMKHYREFNVNAFALLEFKDINQTISTLEEDIRELYINDLADKLEIFKVRYYRSPITKKLVQDGLKKISDFVKNNLQKST